MEKTELMLKVKQGLVRFCGGFLLPVLLVVVGVFATVIGTGIVVGVGYLLEYCGVEGVLTNDYFLLGGAIFSLAVGIVSFLVLVRKIDKWRERPQRNCLSVT